MNYDHHPFRLDIDAGECRQLFSTPLASACKRPDDYHQFHALEQQAFVLEGPEDIEPGPVACNCKHSKCLKLYCHCFRAGKMCGQDCLCSDCHNLDRYQTQRLHAIESIKNRNPLAFKPRLDTATITEEGKIQTAVHYRGCHCKKSHCQKKYCECFQMGVECTDICRCVHCKNDKKDSLKLAKRPPNREKSIVQRNLQDAFQNLDCESPKVEISIRQFNHKVLKIQGQMNELQNIKFSNLEINEEKMLRNGRNKLKENMNIQSVEVKKGCRKRTKR